MVVGMKPPTGNWADSSIVRHIIKKSDYDALKKK